MILIFSPNVLLLLRAIGLIVLVMQTSKMIAALWVGVVHLKLIKCLLLLTAISVSKSCTIALGAVLFGNLSVVAISLVIRIVLSSLLQLPLLLLLLLQVVLRIPGKAPPIRKVLLIPVKVPLILKVVKVAAVVFLAATDRIRHAKSILSQMLSAFHILNSATKLGVFLTLSPVSFAALIV